MTTNSRNSTIHMEIIDPEAPDAKEPITDLISLGDQFLIIKANGVYQAHFPEEIDKENIAPDTKPTYTKLYSIGSTNPYLALGFLQFKGLVAFSVHKDQIFHHLWDTTRYLLSCEENLYYIYSETIQRGSQGDKIITENRHNPAIPLLPTIPFLEEHVAQFLIDAKHCLIYIFKIFHILLQTPDTESNFESYYKWFEDRKEKYNEIYLTLQQDRPWIKEVSNLRNAIEHPNEGQNVEIHNIKLLPGNKLCIPGWRYDLSRKGCRKQDDFSDIVTDMNTILHNLLSFQEDITALCLNQELINTKSWLRIGKKSEGPANCKTKFFLYRIT